MLVWIRKSKGGNLEDCTAFQCDLLRALSHENARKVPQTVSSSVVVEEYETR